MPQPVLNTAAPAAIFLTAVIEPGCEQQVLELLPDVAGLTRSAGFRVPDGGLTCVVGIGSSAWDKLFGTSSKPPGLHPFKAVSGALHRAPATPGDLLFHIRAARMDLCFELATLLTSRLGHAVTVVDEVHAFRYYDKRDLLGFVDGTENPVGPAASSAALVAEGPFVGGSYVVTQKYLHNLKAWADLSVEEQEQVIGRTKLSDVELDKKPSNSHVALNTVTAGGVERKILRDNMVFGSVGSSEFGTYFIGYAADPELLELLLRNMFIGVPPGNHDRVLDFSTAMTGNLYFCPASL